VYAHSKIIQKIGCFLSGFEVSISLLAVGHKCDQIEPNLSSDVGSLFLHSDIQCTAMQQANVTLVEMIATQQKDVAVQSTLSTRNEVKVRCDETDL
jgi:hypothetical protein